MKALSLKQPWAELILQGKKTIEIRKWNTNFRGKFLIHASKNPDKNSMQKFSFTDLPCGFIVGEVNLIATKRYNSKEDFENDKRLHLATEDFGKYGFILRDVKRVPLSKASGKLGFWDFPSKIYKE